MNPGEPFLRAQELYTRFQDGGDPRDLERAMTALDEVLESGATETPVRTVTLVNLAGFLLVRDGLRPDPAGVDRATDLLTEAARTADTSAMAATVHGRLCALQLTRYERQGEDGLLDQAIDHGVRAMRAAPPGAPDLDEHRVTLAHAYRTRGERHSRADDLGQAVDLYRAAVHVTPPKSPELRDRLTDLGSALIARYQVTGDDHDLQSAEELLAEAAPPGATDPAGVTALAAVAGGLLNRWNRDPGSLNRAIELYRRAITASPRGTAMRIRALCGLATALAARSEHAEAITHLREAREQSPPGPERNGYAATLGSMLTGEEAITLLRDALAEPGAGDSAALHTSMAHALSDRGGETLAEHHLRQALDATPPESPAHPARRLDLGLALIGRQALDEGHDHLRTACRSGLTTDPASALRAAFSWGRTTNSQAAQQAYAWGSTAAHKLLSSGLPRSSRQSWLRLSDDLHAALAAVTPDARAAALAIEVGQTLHVSGALDLARLGLSRLADEHPQLTRRHQQATARLRSASAPALPPATAPASASAAASVPASFPASALSELSAARAELDATISEIRTLEGFPEFQAPPTSAEVTGPAATRPLVYLSATESSGLAVIVRGDEVTALRLPDLTAAAARRSTSLDDLTSWLWTAAMGPVIESLKPDRDHLIALIPTGPLTGLPLHAAWTTDPSTATGRRYAMDHAAWTYTASARALTTALAAAQTTPPAHSVIISDPQPRAGTAELAAVAALGAVVKNLAPGGPRVLRGPAATLEATTAALPEADLLHLACHGRPDLTDPLQSHLVLGDGVLPLEEVLRTRLPVRLAVLAAYGPTQPESTPLTTGSVIEAPEAARSEAARSEAARSEASRSEAARSEAPRSEAAGSEAPRETVSLAVGLVQAGAATVVAPMWTADPLATALLLTEFYRHWPDVPAGVALARAQRRLRDTTADELRAEWDRALAAEEPWLPAETADDLLLRIALDPATDRCHRPWSDPVAWASMTCTGA